MLQPVPQNEPQNVNIGDRNNFPPDNERLRTELADTLANDVRVDDQGINVDLVAGTAYLTGVVPSTFQKRIAGQLAARIKGVMDVSNELVVRPVNTCGDDQIAVEVKRVLRHDAWLKSERIKVVVSEGVVYLSGTVEDGQEKAAAEDDARTVQGVVEVTNDLDIAPHVTRTDEEIAAELRRDLDRNIRTRPGQIKVSVRDGIVFLDGTVDTVIQRWISEDVARWIPGAIDVVNHLAIAGP